MSKKVLVTGGAGYIGTHLVELLLNEGYNVNCVDRFFFGDKCLKQLKEKFKGNLTLSKNDIRFLKKEDFTDIEIVFDLAGLSNDPSCDLDESLTESVNIEGNKRVATLAKEAGVKQYIFASSCSVYGSGGDSVLTEESEMLPVSLYAKSKIEVEKHIFGLQSDDFVVTALRNATVYGLSPRMRFDLIVNIMTMYALSKRKIIVLGGGDQWRPLVHGKDVCKAFLTVAKADKSLVNGEAFNVGCNEQNYTVIEVANLVQEEIPWADIEVAPDDPDKRSYNVDFTKIKERLNFTPDFTVEDGIKEVKAAIRTRKVNPDDIKCSTLKYYQYLIKADEVLKEVKIDGLVF